MRRALFFALVAALLGACSDAGTPTATPPPTPTAIRVPSRPSPTATAPAPVPPAPPASCPATRPPDPPFVPPSPPAPSAPTYGRFWYGTAALWTELRADGKWFGGVNTEGIFNKSIWWRRGYDAYAEPQPPLAIAARRLDTPAPTVEADQATNALLPDGDAMLTGLTLPAWGCWELTAWYRGAAVIFVVWVAADPR